MSRLSASRREPLAIVGIGCRFPGGISSPDQYWKRLCEGFDAIGPVPVDRWDSRLHYSPHIEAPRKIIFDRGGFLEQSLYEFDARFFGITAREAAALDPQQRLLLEVTWECCEDALVPAESLEGSQTGVFVGSFGVDHGLIQQGYLNLDLLDAHAATGATATMVAARLAHAFDLRGPCITIDTACSASLVAFHYACQAIWNGECEAAFSGGANVMLSPTAGISPSKGRFFSPDSRSKAFDEKANGYGRGEGAGVVLLKPLSQARAEGARIYAVVRASGVNHDGRTAGVSLPNRAAQAALLARVHALAGGEPVQYVEAHGTGTALGDPTELEALGEGLRLTPSRPLRVGSVKSNIGHLEAAAGVAGLIKATLALQHKQIPPHIGMTRPNPAIAFDELGIVVPTALEAWPEHPGKARAGVNSFGYGGTNAHVVLEEAPAQPQTAGPATTAAAPLFLPLSARDPKAVLEVARRFRDFLRDAPSDVSLEDLLDTSARRRSHHHHRLAIVARTREELEHHLEAFVERGANTGIARGEAPYGPAPSLTFVYTGMGPQTWTMGSELRRHFPGFAGAFGECLERLSELSGKSLFAELEARAQSTEPPGAAAAQWLNLALQVGLTRLFASFGVSPDTLVGHSVGEIAAAHAAGALSLEDAVCVAYHRGRLQGRIEGQGGMLALELDASAFREIDEPCAKLCEIAAINAPGSLTLAGPVPALKELQELLDGRGVFSRMLRVRVPYHSALMDGIRDEFLDAIAKIRPLPPKHRLVSTATLTDDGLRDAGYWWQNVRDPVEFERAVARLPEGPQIVLQIGPHPVLTPALKSCFAARLQNPAVLHSLHRERPEAEALIEALGGLYAGGLPMNWDRIAPAGRPVHSLPHYPWQREHHWHETEASRTARSGPRGHVLLQQRAQGSVQSWHTDLTEGYFGYLKDHRAEDRPLFPAAGYVEVGVAVRQALKGEPRTRLENLSFHTALLLSEHMSERIEIRHDPSDGSLTISGRQGAAGDDPWSVLCTATISSFTPEDAPVEALDPAREGFTRLDRNPYIDRSLSYFYYGPCFRSIRELWLKEESYVAVLELPEQANPENDAYFIHPVLLDGAWQAAVVLGHTILCGGNPDGIMMPVSIDRFEFLASPGARAVCRGRVKNYSKQTLELDMELFDESGTLCARLAGMRWTFVRTRHAPSEEDIRALLFVPGARKVEPAPRAAPAVDSWVLIGADAAPAASLRRALEKLGARAEYMDVERALADPALAQCRGIAYLASGAGAEPENLAQSAELETSRALCVLQRLTELGLDASARVACVTRGAQAVSGEALVRPDLAALWGLARAFGNEKGGAAMLLCDLSAEGADAEWDHLAAELCAPVPRPQLMFRAGAVHELTLDPAGETRGPEAAAAVAVERVTATESVALSSNGSTSQLEWVEVARRAPGQGEVELRVEATAINFKDLMKVSGIISDAVTRGTFLGQELGMECAGVVARIGPGVTRVEVGERVGAITPGCFATYVTCPESTLTPLLPGVPAEQSVVYATFTTVVRALEDLARLGENETILIHSAAGALGLAAIQYAKWRGARVFATASTPRKRAYLQGLGVERVGDSRSLAFADEVRSWTSGRGVDVVLNFLAGEARLQSLALLATGGRFVDVGKPGGVRSAQLPARLFNTNMSFANVDLDQLLQESPEIMQRLAKRVVELFALGHFQGLPTQVFEPDEIRAAFALMSRAEHIGKIVVGFEGREIGLSRGESQALRPERSYLVTGAFGGFGLSVCRWLVDRGARNLLMFSRSGATGPGAVERIRELQARGATVTVVAGDVGEASAVRGLIGRCGKDLPELAGIVHAAMVLDDGVFTSMTPERIGRVMRAKAFGAIFLREATRHLELDFLLLFSSIASLTGGVGQANYASANAFLDGYARYLRGQGCPATAVNWGVLSESGVVARNPELMRLLADQGMIGMTDDEALAGLDRILASSWAEVACMKLDWTAISTRAADSGFTGQLLKSASAAEPSLAKGLAALAAVLAETPRENPLELAETCVGAVVATVLRTSADRLEIRRPLNAAGIDSLMATELSVALFREYGMRFTVLDLLRTLSVADIAARVLEKLRPKAEVGS